MITPRSATFTADFGKPTLGWSQRYGYDRYLTSRSPGLNILADASTNRMVGFSYDGNGNLHSGNWGYDIENRLVSVDTGGGEPYIYDPSNKRIYNQNNSLQVNGGGETYYFYGLDGKVMGEYAVAWGNSRRTMQLNRVTESAYFAGKKVLPTVARDRLGSVRGASSAVNKPYGENYTAGNTDGFATYYQDSATGLSYADQRYYAATYGRFTTFDPYGDNWDLENPQSWNSYSYVNSDPANLNDPDGLDCSSVTLNGWSGVSNGTTLGTFLKGNTDLSILTETIFTEARQSTDVLATTEKSDIASVIMNRWQFVNGYWNLLNKAAGSAGSGGVRVVPDWGAADGTIASVVYAPSQFAVWQSPGQLTSTAQTNLNSALTKDATSVNCESLLQSFATAWDYWGARNNHGLYFDPGTGLIFTSFHSGSNPVKSSYESWIGSSGSGNVFSGVSDSQVLASGVPIPQPRPIRPPRRRR